MAISIDYDDIQQACEKFKLEPTDYYIEFTNHVVYIYWVASPDQIADYIEGDYACLDFQSKGRWLSFDYYKDQYVKRPFTNMRYILAAE